MGLFPQQPVTIPLSRTSSAVVRDLHAAIDNTLFRGIFRDRFVGHVSEDRIRMQYVRAGWRNPFPACFVGRVHAHRGCIEGRFRLSAGTRAWLWGWIALFGFLASRVILTRVPHQGWTAANLKLLAFTAGMVLVGAWVLPRFGWHGAREDIVVIEAKLRRAADGPGA